MNGTREEGPRRGGLLFFAALTASATHELNNVLSIVDQSGGLLGDLAAMAESGKSIDPARLETLQQRIGRQVRKGVDLLGHLNRLAHSLDAPPPAKFDLGAETENLVALAGRLAALKIVRLEYRPGAEQVSVSGDSFATQQRVFTILQKVLEGSEEGDRITVGVRSDGDEAVVSIVASAVCGPTDDDPWTRHLTDLTASLEGSFAIRSDERAGTSFELRLPLAPG